MRPGSRYPHLFTPLRLGPTTIDNRVVFTARLTNYARQGLPTEQHAAYYAARAAGGAGLIVTEEHTTHPSDRVQPDLIRGYDPAVVPGYRRITDAVHAHRVPILAQLNHNGAHGTSVHTRQPLWAPSAVANPAYREVPKAMDGPDISALIDGFGVVADHSVAGGFDGIELSCAQSSIVRAFLSPATNLRTDRYGGPLVNRARLLLELISEVRRAIGPQRVLGVRLCGDELMHGGTTLEEAVALARLVEHTGKVDYISTSMGVAGVSLYLTEATMHVPPGYALFVANAIRRSVDLPVIGMGRFNSPLQAERALADGHCDLVALVRGQIADPDFAAKARVGAAEAIRSCLSCNQECTARVGDGRWLGCVANPRAGRESEPPLVPVLPKRARPTGGPAGELGDAAGAATRPEVLVVGAGPAGLQTALTAARAGHSVRVVEREPHAGGQVRIAAAAPGRVELGDLVRNQIAECRRLQVPIVYDTVADVDLVRRTAPSAVVVATGARPVLPDWAGRHPRVVDSRAVLRGAVFPTGSVLVVDELGFHHGPSVAELLADRGCAVEILTSATMVGRDLSATLDLETWCVRAAAKGITETCERRVVELKPAGVDSPTGGRHHDDPSWHEDRAVGTGAPADAQDAAGALRVTIAHPAGPQREERTVDWIVCAYPAGPQDELYWQLRIDNGTAATQLFRVGDCVAPRLAHAAVLEGDRVGAALGLPRATSTRGGNGR
ncbi:mycofactocin system FadH/OYE family oxidoreductase 2 [Lipingzhangella sp. LS1_29]|uniref:Mycofactocin system FadH/OYE family oxidoreductase 2 n=1 Tax=Lipingzhangella rawalii TaxID=2055835 RepID=A0ABU2H6I9_9ACTN|nr:mycofactocin system FadH/OYE family oxidoreductase 2 [Lipingzhangella rawalii]MDS1270926.1 mycofactocin system FadH/OYE family oxidoreductase 2 [Lipingzhangella rawalii]